MNTFHINQYIGLVILLVIQTTASCSDVNSPEPFGPTSSARQIAWHDMEYYALVHFTTTTFRDVEWGYGDAESDEFQPSKYNLALWLSMR